MNVTKVLNKIKSEKKKKILVAILVQYREDHITYTVLMHT